jgi:acetyl-CoA carboxylase carboxyltransferase component
MAQPVAGDDAAVPAEPSKLEAVRDAHRAQLDEARPTASARHKAKGRLTARENIADLLDAESFVEYGMLARPARAGMEGAADGLVMGTGTVDGLPVAAVAYDYTVHAGTQSAVNHMKIDHMFDLAIRNRLPTICWLEGGGARPHDLNVGLRGAAQTFVAFARLSGLAPTIGVVAGRAFAGNANLAGLCDVLIATPQAVLGMAGPPLVEAALGHKLTPEEIGPADVHLRTGVIDVLASDEREANQIARRYLGYFRGRQPAGTAPDVERLRHLVPENPRRAYDIRRVIEHIADVDTALELKAQYGRAMVTALGRIEGFPVGFIADQPMVLGGVIDAPAAEKAARFIDLCDAYDVPMVFLCDTPGLMVGPDTERTGLVRRSARLLQDHVLPSSRTRSNRRTNSFAIRTPTTRSEHPDVLVSAAQASDVGPLQALIDELEFNAKVAAKADSAEQGCAFHEHQFLRAIHEGSIAILRDEIRDAVTAAYVAMGAANRLIETAWTPPKGSNGWPTGSTRPETVSSRPVQGSMAR